MRLVVEAETERVTGLLQQIEHRLDDSAVLRLLGAAINQYEADLFASDGHGQWAPNDPATIALKGSGRVLVDTGDLLRHLTTSYRISGETVQVVAGGAAWALKKGARGMPKRDPAPEPPRNVVDAWGEQLLGYLVTGRR